MIRNVLVGAVSALFCLLIFAAGAVAELHTAPARMRVDFVAQSGTPIDTAQVCLVDSVRAMRCMSISDYLLTAPQAAPIGDL